MVVTMNIATVTSTTDTQDNQNLAACAFCFSSNNVKYQQMLYTAPNDSRFNLQVYTIDLETFVVKIFLWFV